MVVLTPVNLDATLAGGAGAARAGASTSLTLHDWLVGSDKTTEGGEMSLHGFRIHHSNDDRRARAKDADVDRGMEMLGVEVSVGKACISGRVRDIRRRLGTLLDDLLPPVARPALWRRLLRRAGPTVRTRAVDAAFTALFDEHLPNSHHVSLCSLGGTNVSGEQVLPEKAMREVIAGALDDAYCVLLPHEAAHQAEQHRAFWAD